MADVLAGDVLKATMPPEPTGRVGGPTTGVGCLLRGGLMDEDLPESPRWAARAPEREAEQRKLEEKRRAVRGRLEYGNT